MTKSENLTSNGFLENIFEISNFLGFLKNFFNLLYNIKKWVFLEKLVKVIIADWVFS